MGSKQQRNAKQISNSPKQSTKKIAFKNQYESADPLYKNLKIIKFQDLLRLNNCLFMCQLEQNKKLASTFPGLVYTKEKHNYNTRSARKNLLDIPLCQTFTYGMQSYKYQCIEDWNRFKSENSTENLTYPVVKNVFKKNVLVSSYFFTDFGSFFMTLFVYRTNRERSVMFFFVIYLSETSESSDYSCDFCQQKSGI